MQDLMRFVALNDQSSHVTCSSALITRAASSIHAVTCLCAFLSLEIEFIHAHMNNWIVLRGTEEGIEEGRRRLTGSF